MGYFSKFLGISAALMMLSAAVAGAEERDPLKSRVPADQMADAKAMKNRKDGELFWVIKNGSTGTGMISLTPAIITEEEAWTIINYERTFCKPE